LIRKPKRKRWKKYLPKKQTLIMATVVIVSFLIGRWTYQSGLLDFREGNPREGTLVTDTNGLSAEVKQLEANDPRELIAGVWVVEAVEGSLTMAIGDRLEFEGNNLRIKRPSRTDRLITFDLHLDRNPSNMYWLEIREDQYMAQSVVCSLFGDQLLLTIPLDGKLPSNHGANKRDKIELVLLRRANK
jgi:hypothetical protein